MVNLYFKWTGNRKAATTGVWGRISVLALSLVCVVACQQATREVPAQEDAGTTQAVSSAEHKVEAPVHEVPAGEGVFARSLAAGKRGEDRTQKFTAIKTGRKNLLLATNAERGFGFAFPTGTVIPGNVRDFTLKLDGVRPEFLQITQYRGVAAPTPHPLDPPDDTNTAWIPTRAIPIDVQEYEDFIDIHLEAPLQPGFYVLHDDSLMRARHNEDVTFYHPFRVMASGSVSPWDVDSERCFADLVPRLSGGKALSREVRERLQACATAQRLSWKLHLDDRTDHSAMRMLYLARFLAPDDAVVQRQLNAATTKPQNEIELEIYRVAQEDQIERLDAIYAQLQGGGEPDEATMRAAVRFIRPESQDVGLRSLLWIPFWRVAPGPEALGRLFDAGVAGRNSSNGWGHCRCVISPKPCSQIANCPNGTRNMRRRFPNGLCIVPMRLCLASRPAASRLGRRVLRACPTPKFPLGMPRCRTFAKRCWRVRAKRSCREGRRLSSTFRSTDRNSRG